MCSSVRCAAAYHGTCCARTRCRRFTLASRATVSVRGRRRSRVDCGAHGVVADHECTVTATTHCAPHAVAQMWLISCANAPSIDAKCPWPTWPRAQSTVTDGQTDHWAGTRLRASLQGTFCACWLAVRARRHARHPPSTSQPPSNARYAVVCQLLKRERRRGRVCVRGCWRRKYVAFVCECACTRVMVHWCLVQRRLESHCATRLPIDAL